MSDILSWHIPWLEERPSLGGHVLGTRLRVSRNINHIPFPEKADSQDLEFVVERVRSILREKNPLPCPLILPIHHLGAVQKGLLEECGFAEPPFFADGKERFFVFGETGADSLLVNYENHLSAQVFLGGLALTPAWEEAHALISSFEHLGFAFDRELGYLTSSPQTVGTGLQASVLLNLPGLEMTRQIKPLVRRCTAGGASLHRLYSGKRSRMRSSFFLLSNGTTLGESEEDILEMLRRVVVDVVAREQRAISKLQEEGTVSFADKLWRSYGMMRFARYVDFEEALFHLSLLRVGMTYTGIPAMRHGDWKKLFMNIQPYHIRAWCMENGIVGEENEMRAFRIRDALEKNGQNQAKRGSPSSY